MKKYIGIDWLRAIACIGIMAMHVAANNAYEIGGFVYQRVIPSLTDFVFAFMAVSAFGMCCGYFEKVMSGKVNWTQFYKKRYGKVLPFFFVLIVIDLLIGFSVGSLFEGLTEMTLLHGFVPNDLKVIGVGWYLGTVFVFYLIFPFFCTLIEKKSRAWCVFAVSIVLNYICEAYFHLSRDNIIYSLCYFLAGGMIYLYKDKLENLKWYISAPAVVLAAGCYYLAGECTLTRLLVTAALLVCAVSLPAREVRAISFMSNISLEFYLSHMVVFRAIELLHFNTLFGNGWVQYFAMVAMVFTGTVLFSAVSQKVIDQILVAVKRKKREGAAV